MFRSLGLHLGKHSAAARLAFPSSLALAQLRRRLRSLKASNKAAESILLERRRLTSFQRDSITQRRMRKRQGRAWQATSSSSAADSSSFQQRARQRREISSDALKLLPHNRELEAAIAFALSENRDARTELEFTRHLLNSTLLSLASPVGMWDPYDVKPQVFALDTYLALPVFTSIEYLRLFCDQFRFPVRDPSGQLWADGAGADGEGGVRTVLLPEAVLQSEWWSRQGAQHTPESETGGASSMAASKPSESCVEREDRLDAALRGMENGGQDQADCSPSSLPLVEESTQFMSADALFEDLENPTPVVAAASDRQPAGTVRKGRSKKKTKMRLSGGKRDGWKRMSRGRKSARATPYSIQSRPQGENGSGGESSGPASSDEDRTSAFLRSVAAVSPFRFKQATPLPTFGPIIRPFFVGYFADINTLLHNASIVPNKVDIILNPCSPVEFVLAREATDKVLFRDQLLLTAYQRVEKELQREFSHFFALHCPEVRRAKSACVPTPLDPRTADVARAAGRQCRDAENPLVEHRERTRLLRESEFSNGVAYELVLLLESDDLAETFTKIQWAKHKCLLMGHSDLDVLPEEVAAPYVREAATLFYDSELEHSRNSASSEVGEASRVGSASPTSTLEGGDSYYATASSDNSDEAARASTRAKGSKKGNLGVFRRLGTPQTVSAVQDADSYFHDPTNAYTESHAVFTEELRLRRNQ